MHFYKTLHLDRRRFGAVLGALGVSAVAPRAFAQDSGLPPCEVEKVVGDYKISADEEGWSLWPTDRPDDDEGVYFWLNEPSFEMKYPSPAMNGTVVSTDELTNGYVKLIFDEDVTLTFSGKFKKVEKSPNEYYPPELYDRERSKKQSELFAKNLDVIIEIYDGETLVYKRTQGLRGITRGAQLAENIHRRQKAAYEAKRCEDTSFCFLTTACCQAVGLSDNCWELRAARRLRDTWLTHTPAGRAEIEKYYRIAPDIVAAIHARPNARTLLMRLYAFHILPTCLLAGFGLNRLAHWRYRSMVASLERRFY